MGERDGIMSNLKTVPSGAHGRLATNKLKIAEGDAAGRKAAPAVEATSLQIDREFDQDCDPYNRTGQFFAIGKN